jgi:two-component system chemotaxis sensor kinase CheA
MEEYKDIFLAEARDYLQGMTECLLELEKDPSRTEHLAEIFRAAHSLKGMAGAMGYVPIAKTAHDLENMLESLRSGEIKINTELVSLLFEAQDTIQLLIDNVDDQQSFQEETEALRKKLKSWNYQAQSCNQGVQEEKNENFPVNIDLNELLNEFEKETLKEAAFQDQNVYYVRVQLRDETLLKSVCAYMVVKEAENYGEIIKTFPEAQELENENFGLEFSFLVLGSFDSQELQERIKKISEVEDVGILLTNTADLRHKSGEKQKIQKNGKSNGTKNNFQELKTVRVETAKLDILVNLVGELLVNRTHVVELGKQFESERLKNALSQLEKITSNLQDAAMALRMTSVKQVFDRFPRMIRDLSIEKNKEINLIIRGEDTELDRTIVNRIGDPLVHLLRNAVDHGIETPEERQKNGKLPAGTIILEARHEGSCVIISVEDDGKGLDPEVIKEKALSKNLISPEEIEKMSSEEIINLIFKSGFSTASEITDVSGRGVGMDVVRASIESLNGTVEVKTIPGKGTKFFLRLPLTLATIKVLLLKVGNETYAIPSETITKNLFVASEKIKTMGHNKAVLLKDEIIPLYSLKEKLGAGCLEDKPLYCVVVVNAGGRKLGLIVDKLIKQQEVVIKSLHGTVKNIKGISGATVLGDGSVVLIFDPANLVE